MRCNCQSELPASHLIVSLLSSKYLQLATLTRDNFKLFPGEMQEMQECCAILRWGVVWCKADYLQEMRNVTGCVIISDKTPDTRYHQRQDRNIILATSLLPTQSSPHCCPAELEDAGCWLTVVNKLNLFLSWLWSLYWENICKSLSSVSYLQLYIW